MSDKLSDDERARLDAEVRRDYEMSAKWPFDASDAWWNDDSRYVALPAVDSAHAAARAIIRDLSDRGGIKRGFENIDEETRGEIVAKLAAIIRAASPAPAIPAGDWQPVETAPEGELVVVFWLDPNAAVELECYDFDMLEDGSWRQWTDHYEWAHSVAPVTEVPCTMPREHPPYTHWKRLGTPTEPAPAISESDVLRHRALAAEARCDHVIKILTRIHGSLLPNEMRLPDGRVFEFNNPKVEHEMLRGLRDAIRAVPDEIAAIDAERKENQS
ncbi:hypothetical protein DM48_350 [Burkholderia gladioli]|uniref:Phage protein n=1 Tax=Burkholderia gladioli TaxID=28095 RepID=A0AAW3F327_BURGA|nr:hypothetical protein [Burkholderia gladioli]KGC15247.1 hypothetical protein DM48_350 [Burkholderia gladioli]